MNKIFTLLSLLLLFNACSSNNAFDNFKMDKDQELSVSSMRSAKVASSSGEVSGIFSSVYLNEVYPESFNDGEYFFVYVYLKKQKEMYNPKELFNTGLNLKLNSKLAVKIEELPKENKFSHLVSVKSEWNKYYKVVFMEDEERKLNLVLENGPSFSAQLNFLKAEQ